MPFVRPPSLAALVTFVLFACVGDGTSPRGADLVKQYGLELLPAMVHPADNQPNSDRIELGRLLFFDPILSGPKEISCGTCHLPEFGMSDGLSLSLGPSGERLGPDRALTDPAMVPHARNSLTVINVGFNRFVGQWTSDGFVFWDGRRRRIENLMTMPMRERTEMRADVYSIEATLDSVLARLRSIDEYQQRFRQAFPEKPPEAAIDSSSLAKALAQFIRSLVSNTSAYDRFVAGDDNALTEQQKQGLMLFHEKGGCARCHVGAMFSDFDFHVVGARQLPPGFKTTPHEDFGRWNATHLEEDRWRFRTPSLRNVAETEPYTHAGAYKTLREMVEFFNRGGGDHLLIPGERVELKPLGLSDDGIDALVAFLEALTDLPPIDVPDRLPSGLEPPIVR